MLVAHARENYMDIQVCFSRLNCEVQLIIRYTWVHLRRLRAPAEPPRPHPLQGLAPTTRRGAVEAEALRPTATEDVAAAAAIGKYAAGADGGSDAS